MKRGALSAAILFLVLAGRAFAQISPQLGPNASGVGFYIVSPSCASQPQVSGANLCFDTVVGQLFSFGGATYSVPTTGSAAAGGTTGSLQYNLAGVLAGLSGSCIPRLNGAGAPTCAAAGTDYQAVLSGGSPASTTIGGSGLSAPAANGFLYSNGASPFGLLNLTADQVPVGTAGAPISLSLLNCAADGLHSEVYSTASHTFSCVTVTASVTAPGSTGSTVWTNGTVLAAFSGMGILRLNGSTSPSIAVAGTDYAPITSGSAPLFGNSAGGFTNGTVSGSGTEVATVSGAVTNGHLAQWQSGNLVDGGGSAGIGTQEINICSGSGTTSGTYQGYEEITGHTIKVSVYLNAYYNSGATAQNCLLTNGGGSAFASSGGIVSNVPNFAAGLTGAPANTVTLPVGMDWPVTGVVLAEGQ